MITTNVPAVRARANTLREDMGKLIQLLNSFALADNELESVGQSLTSAQKIAFINKVDQQEVLGHWNELVAAWTATEPIE